MQPLDHSFMASWWHTRTFSRLWRRAKACNLYIGYLPQLITYINDWELLILNKFTEIYYINKRMMILQEIQNSVAMLLSGEIERIYTKHVPVLNSYKFHVFHLYQACGVKRASVSGALFSPTFMYYLQPYISRWWLLSYYYYIKTYNEKAEWAPMC